MKLLSTIVAKSANLSVPVKVSILVKYPPTANSGRINIARVADNAPGFFRIAEELDDAVASRLKQFASIGISENVNNNAPIFCKNSPALTSPIKNGGTVTNSRIIPAVNNECDQIGFWVLYGIMW